MQGGGDWSSICANISALFAQCEWRSMMTGPNDTLLLQENKTCSLCRAPRPVYAEQVFASNMILLLRLRCSLTWSSRNRKYLRTDYRVKSWITAVWTGRGAWESRDDFVPAHRVFGPTAACGQRDHKQQRRFTGLCLCPWLWWVC